MRGIDPDALDDLSANAVSGGGEALLEGLGQGAGGDGDAGQVRHLLGAADEFGGGVGACAGAEEEVEGVFGVDC